VGWPYSRAEIRMTAAPLTFIVPGQPVAKGRARTFIHRQSGKNVSMTPEKTIVYENLVRMAFVEKYPGHVPIEGPIELRVWASFQSPKRRKWTDSNLHTTRPDADNIAKSICDALNGIAWRDDSAVCNLAVQKRYTWTAPRVDIFIKQLPPAVAGRE
jgi:Holliday junction resolvase RusA-like endonuclease